MIDENKIGTFAPCPDDRRALPDHLAVLTRDPGARFTELRQVYDVDPRLKAPPIVYNAVRQQPETVGDL